MVMISLILAMTNLLLILNKGSLQCILVMLLLLVGCSPTEPENVHGCLDSQACNYNSNATPLTLKI